MIPIGDDGAGDQIASGSKGLTRRCVEDSDWIPDVRVGEMLAAACRGDRRELAEYLH